MSEAIMRVRLLFADDGAFHHEDIEIPASSLEGYERLIDCVREDRVILKRMYVDVERLCAAYLVEA